MNKDIPLFQNQPYQKYSPNVFDDSLSLYEQIITFIEYLNKVIDNSNDVTTETLTLRSDFSKFKTLLESSLLPDGITKTLMEWKQSGLLKNIINDELFASKTNNDDFNTFVLDTTKNFNDVDTILSQSLKKTDVGILDLTIFNEATRSVLLGLVGGEINAVLGIENVKPENTTFLTVSKNLINPLRRKNGFGLGFSYAVDGVDTYTSNGSLTSYQDVIQTNVGDIIYSNTSGRIVWYGDTNKVVGSTSFVFDENINLFKATVGGGIKTKVDGFLSYINVDGYWFVSKNSISNGKQIYGNVVLDDKIKSNIFSTKIENELLSSRIDDIEKPVSDVTFFIPKYLYCYDNVKNNKWIEKYNLLATRNLTNFYLNISAPYGALKDYDRVKSQGADDLNIVTTNGDESVYRRIYNQRVIDPSKKSNPFSEKNVLLIGDSFFDQSVLPCDIKNQIVNVHGFDGFNFIGSKTSVATINGNEITCNNEGRGGFTIEDFTKSIQTQGRGSVFPNPFIFNGSVDFSEYMSFNEINGVIDYVIINLGVNDLILNHDDGDSIKIKMKLLIDLIRESYVDCKIFINGLVMISEINGQYDTFIHNSLVLKINKGYEELCEQTNCVYIDTNVYFDSSYGYNTQSIPYRGSVRDRIVQTDWLHPSESGYYMIADTDASAFIYHM